VCLRDETKRALTSPHLTSLHLTTPHYTPTSPHFAAPPPHMTSHETHRPSCNATQSLSSSSRHPSGRPRRETLHRVRRLHPAERQRHTKPRFNNRHMVDSSVLSSTTMTLIGFDASRHLAGLRLSESTPPPTHKPPWPTPSPHHKTPCHALLLYVLVQHFLDWPYFGGLLVGLNLAGVAIHA
jgi:hypothetical protein